MTWIRRDATLAVLVAAIAAGAAAFAACHAATTGTTSGTSETGMAAKPRDIGDPDGAYALATFGGGCFWCTEAVFQEVEGVLSVTSGYSGGTVPEPTYEQICTGTTGHAEAIQVRYDPSKVGYATLLEIFFGTHDPTTRDRQGADTGTQYRSVIFTHDDEQKRVAEEVKRALDASAAYDDDPIVTEIVPIEDFYAAEKYHQGYFAANPSQGYCRAVIRPKLDKFRKVFKDRLKG
jgi:peptide-methionine (S)-S-oxide reductase